MKIVQKILALALLLIIGVVTTYAQSTPTGGSASGGGGGGGGVVATPVVVPPPVPVDGKTPVSAALPFDISAVTNRAALASWALRHVDHILVSVYDRADASFNSENNGERFVFSFNNTVKSLTAMESVITNNIFSFNVVDPTQPAYIDVEFTLGYPSDDYERRDGNITSQTLLYANNGGSLVETGKENSYTLNPSSSRLQVRLSGSIRMSIPGLAIAKVIYQSGGHSYNSSTLDVNGNGEFWFPSEAAGAGIIVLYGNFDGKGYQTTALSLVTGKRVALKKVDIRLLFESSNEIYSFVDPTNIDIEQFAFYGYALNPLIVVKTTQTNGTRLVQLKVHTTEDQWPDGYTVLQLETGKEVFLPVPEKGDPTVTLQLPGGEFHIIPHLEVKSPFLLPVNQQ